MILISNYEVEWSSATSASNDKRALTYLVEFSQSLQNGLICDVACN